MVSFTREDLDRFLNRPMMGVVATVRRDGSPHAAPVWYRYDGQKIIIWTARERIWVKNLQRDNRAAFTVQDNGPPRTSVTVRGRAQVVLDSGEEGFSQAVELSKLYLSEAGAEEYVKKW